MATKPLSAFLGAGEIEIRTGPFGTQLKASEYVDEGTPVINVRNIGFGALRPEKLEYVPEKVASRLHQHRLKAGDVVFGRKGAVERHLLVKADQDGWIQGSDCIRLRIISGSLNPHFLSYCLLLDQHKSWIQSQASHGATMATLNQGIIERIRVPERTTSEQQRIAGILSAYDDLIEVNQRRIAILEDLARRLFDEWFVRFRYPGHTAVPLVETELGMVPEGWFIVRAEEIIDFDPRTKVPKEGFKRFVPMGSLDTVSSVISGWETRSGNSGSKFQSGDTLFARITPCLENGKTGLVNFLEGGEAAFGSTEFTVMRGKNVSSSFVYLLARSEAFRAIAIKSMGGADGRQRVRTEALKAYEIACPPSELLTRFASVTERLLRQVRILADQNARLRAARDLLLPKLISGEIDVSAAEETFAEAAE